MENEDKEERRIDHEEGENEPGEDAEDKDKEKGGEELDEGEH